jgi:hypothetical protein
MDAGYDVTVERSTQRIFDGMYSDTSQFAPRALSNFGQTRNLPRLAPTSSPTLYTTSPKFCESI